MKSDLTDRDAEKTMVQRLREGHCADNMGCGTMTLCVCATAEDAAEHIEKLERELSEAKRDAATGKEFADLWYFAMDHAPGDFERIVTTCSPSSWMHEIAKIKRGEK